MFALGHLGIGKRLAARPFRQFSSAERRAFFVGAVLPDLIDKPLYYIPAWVTGREGAAAGILSGTHLFAHTGLFLLVLTLAALLTRSRPLRALTIGVATHFILDFVGLSLNPGALLWPLFGWRFPTHPFRSLGQHLGTISTPSPSSVSCSAQRFCGRTIEKPGAGQSRTAGRNRERPGRRQGSGAPSAACSAAVTSARTARESSRRRSASFRARLAASTSRSSRSLAAREVATRSRRFSIRRR